MEELMHKQTRVEREMLITGAENYYRRLDNAEEQGRGEDTSYARTAISQLLEPVAEQLVYDMEQAAEAKRPPVAHKVLSRVGCDTAAAIGLRTLFNALTRKSHGSNDVARTSAASEVGRAVQLELKTRALIKDDKKYMNQVIKQWKRRGSSDVQYRMNVVNRLLKLKEIPWQEWSPQVKVHVGASILHAVLESTDMFELVQINKNNKSKNMSTLRLTEQAVEWIDKHQDFMALLQPQYRPMLVPPRDWSKTRKPYVTELVNSTLAFVRTRYNKVKVKPEEVPDAMYKAVSIIQSTAWQIEPAVLELAQNLLKMKHTSLVPEAGNDVPPEFEFRGVSKKDMSEYQEQALKEWKITARMIHDKNVSVRSNRIRFNQTIKLAGEYLENVIYFPHNVDSRGRVYPIPTVLNPQGDDLSKGVLRFAKAEVLTERGVHHLRLQLANKFGIDKESHKDRLDWVHAHEVDIVRLAENPLDNLDFLEESDSPYQFFAACVNYTKWYRNPSAPNHARVNKDGSCNGLQHFAAMTLDADMGKSVNLMPADAEDKPQSVYKVVAEEVKRLTQESNEPMARQWERYWKKYNASEVDYKSMKRPVMTLPYSATAYSRREYIQEYLAGNNGSEFFGDSFTEAVSFMVDVVTQAMHNRISGAMRVLDWLKNCGKLFLSGHNVLEWKNLYGFPVRTYKPDMRACTVYVQYLGKQIKYRMRLPKDTTNVQQCLFAVAPNFVHSMDAQHLLMICNHLRRKIPVHVVHDDVGCPANHGDVLNDVIRAYFCALYEVNPVESFQKELDIEEPLEKVGTLDLNNVMGARYFFD